MATEWHAVQEALATALAAASDATPTPGVHVDIDLGSEPNFEQSIGAVFVDPPASIEPGELPCILLGDDSFSDEWVSSLAVEEYEQQAFLLLRDEDAEVSTQLCKAYRQDIKRVLRRHVKLGLAVVTLHGARFGNMGVIDYAGQSYVGFPFSVNITVNDAAPGFAAG